MVMIQEKALIKEKYVCPEGRHRVKGSKSIQRHSGAAQGTIEERIFTLIDTIKRMGVEIDKLTARNQDVETALISIKKGFEKVLKDKVDLESEQEMCRHYFEIRHEVKEQVVL